MSEAEDTDIKVKVEESEVECDGGRLSSSWDGNHLDCKGESEENGQLPNKRALGKRIPLQNETPEQRRARLDKKNKILRIQRNNETAKQKRARLDKNKARRQNKINSETPEQRRRRLDKEAVRKRRQREDERRRLGLEVSNPDLRPQGNKKEREFEDSWKSKSDEELAVECKRILVEKRDKWKHRVTWDEAPCGRLLMSRGEMQRVMLAYHQFLIKKKKQEQMSEEERARLKEVSEFKKLVKSIHMTEEERKHKRLESFLRRHAYKANLSEEKREKQRQRHVASFRRWFQNISEEQRERVRNSQRKANKKYQQKNKEKLRGYYYKNKVRLVSQAPEQRQKSLQYQRINQAKRLLRRKLEAAGTTQEEIQKQVDQLVSKMKSEPLPPLEQMSTYKPRPRKKQRPEIQTPSVEIHAQDCHISSDAIVRRETLQIASTSGTLLSQNIESDTSGGQLDLPSSSLTLSQPSSASQEETSAEERDTEDYCYPEPDDIFVTPTHSPSPPSPAFYKNTKCSTSTYLSVDNEQIVVDKTSVGKTSPPIIYPSSILQTAAPSIPSTSVSLNENNCPHCPLSFPELSGMQSHIRSTHQKKCWKCPKCSTVVLSSGDLLEHFKSNHAKSERDVNHRTATYTETGKTTKPNSDQPRRRKDIAAPKSVTTFPFICMKCPWLSSKSRFDTIDKLLDHVRISHPKAFWPCPRCKLLKYNPASLKIHSKICSKTL